MNCPKTIGVIATFAAIAGMPAATWGAVNITSAERSVDAATSWSTMLGDAGGADAASFGPSAALGLFDETASAYADDQVGGWSGDVSTATATQTTIVTPSVMSGSLSGALGHLYLGGPAGGVDSVEYESNAYLNIEFDLSVPTEASLALDIDKLNEGPGSSQITLTMYLSKIGGGFFVGVDSLDAELTDGFDGILPAGSYRLRARLRVSFTGPIGGFIEDDTNAGSFSLTLIPAPGAGTLLALTGLAAARRRRRAGAACA